MGVPTVAVNTNVFARLAKSTALANGMPTARMAFVPQPVVDRLPKGSPRWPHSGGRLWLQSTGVGRPLGAIRVLQLLQTGKFSRLEPADGLSRSSRREVRDMPGQ